MTGRRLICRAQVAPDCLNGRPIEECGYEKPLYELEDGTYESVSMSVVCNPCYVDLMPLTPSGQALLHELDTAIKHVHDGHLPRLSEPDEGGRVADSGWLHRAYNRARALVGW